MSTNSDYVAMLTAYGVLIALFILAATPLGVTTTSEWRATVSEGQVEEALRCETGVDEVRIGSLTATNALPFDKRFDAPGHRVCTDNDYQYNALLVGGESSSILTVNASSTWNAAITTRLSCAGPRPGRQGSNVTVPDQLRVVTGQSCDDPGGVVATINID